MILRTLASVLPRQSVRPAINWSIRSDGFIGSLCLRILVPFSCESILPDNSLVILRDSRLRSRLRRPVGHFNAELLCILGVQSLPAAELHGLGADDASDGLTGEKPIQNIETNVPPRSAHCDEAVTDVGPQRQARALTQGF